MRQITRLLVCALPTITFAGAASADADIVQSYLNEEAYIASPDETRLMYVAGLADGISMALRLNASERYKQWVDCTSKFTGVQLRDMVDARIKNDKPNEAVSADLFVAVNKVCKLGPGTGPTQK